VTYSGTKLASNFLQSLANVVGSRTSGSESVGTASALAHLDLGLGALVDVAEDLCERLLEVLGLGDLGGSERDGLSVTAGKRNATEAGGRSGSSEARGRSRAARRSVVGDLAVVKTVCIGDGSRLLGPWRRTGRRARLGGAERGEQLLGLRVEDRRLLGSRSGSRLGSGGGGGGRGTSRRRSSGRGRRRRVDDVLLVNDLLDRGLVVVVLLGQTLGGRQAVGRRASEGGSLRCHDDTSSDKKTVEDAASCKLERGLV
jgi:hypothetical protein